MNRLRHLIPTKSFPLWIFLCVEFKLSFASSTVQQTQQNWILSREFIFSLDKILYYSLWNKKELKFFAEKAVKSSHRRRSVGKGVLRNFAKFTGKHLCQSLFSESLRPATLLKRGSGAGVFREFCEVSKNTFLIEPLWAIAFEQSEVAMIWSDNIFPNIDCISKCMYRISS